MITAFCRQWGEKNLLKERLKHKLSPAELEKAYEMFKEKYNEILLTTPIYMTELRNSLIF